LTSIALLLTVPLLVQPVGAGVAAGAAQVVDASGKAACTVSAGQLVVAPGLTFGGTATSATFTFTGTLTCTGTSGVTGGTFTATGSSTSNNCSTLAGTGIPSISATIDWNGDFAPSNIVFSDGNFSLGTAITILLPSIGPAPPTGTTTVTGSFAFEPVTANFLADQTIGALSAGCNDQTTGLTGLTFTGVNGPSTLDIAEEQTTKPPPPPPSGPVSVGVDATQPGAALNENLVGVNHVVSGSQSMLQAIGTTWARTDVSFEVNAGTPQAAYNCTTGVWNPSYLDSNVALDQKAGAQVELIVDYFPPCLADRTNATERSQWIQLVYQMAEHEITAEGVRVFEVWNEPSFSMPLDGVTGYLSLYQDTANALESAAAAAGVTIEVGGPAVDELGQIDNSWITALASFVAANNLPLDFVSWHQYPNDPGEGPGPSLPSGLCPFGSPPAGLPCWYNPNFDVSLYQRGAEAIRSALAQFPTLHPLVWMDEWAADSGTDARDSGPFGAAFVAAALQSAQAGGIDRMSYYDVADNPSNPTYDSFGLLYGNLTPKPSYQAFAVWHQMAGSLLPVSVTPDQSASAPVGQVSSTATVAGDGTVNVMVDNFVPYDPTGAYGTSDPTPYDHQVTVNLTGLQATSYCLKRSLIDGQDQDATVATSAMAGPTASTTFTLAGEGVTLLSLTPNCQSPAPLTSVTVPATGALRGQQYLDAAASDDVGVTKVEFLLSGGSLTNSLIATATPTIFGWLASWDTTTVPDGTYTLQSEAFDAAGNSALSAGVTIEVENTPPTTNVIVPATGALLGGQQYLDAAASDDVGVTKVEFVLSGGSFTNSVIATATPTLYGWLASWDTTTVPDGTYTLQSEAFDAAGNSTLGAGVTVTIAPTTRVLFPSTGSTLAGGQYLDAAASDNVGVTKVEFHLTGGSLASALIATAAPTIFGWLAPWDTTTVPDGTYTLQSVATNPAGMSTSSAGVTVTVDNLPQAGGFKGSLRFLVSR
jgi:major membrane immunogen (membrane-anchored lipoprotein)